MDVPVEREINELGEKNIGGRKKSTIPAKMPTVVKLDAAIVSYNKYSVRKWPNA